MTDPTVPLIEHSRFCQRRGAPVLIAGFDATPMFMCVSCGRRAPAPDQRPTTHTTHTTEETE